MADAIGEKVNNSTIVKALQRSNAPSKLIREHFNVNLTKHKKSKCNYSQVRCNKRDTAFLTDLIEKNESKSSGLVLNFQKKVKSKKNICNNRSTTKMSKEHLVYESLQKHSKDASRLEHFHNDESNLCEQETLTFEKPKLVRQRHQSSHVETIRNILASGKSDDDIRNIILRNKLKVWERLHAQCLQSSECLRDQTYYNSSLRPKRNDRNRKYPFVEYDGKLGRIVGQLCRKESDERSRKASIDNRVFKCALVKSARDERKKTQRLLMNQRAAAIQQKRLEAFHMRLDLFEHRTHKNGSSYYGLSHLE